MTQRSETLPTKTKFILSLGEFAVSASVGTIVPFYFLFFLTDVAHIAPGLAGTVLLVTRLWDAVNDPLIGSLSDQTQSRWGRRRPFIMFGMLPMGILFALLWIVPPWGNTARAIYYLIIYLLFDTAFTSVAGPFAALTPELTLDADERTSLITWRMAVNILAGLAAAIGMQVVFSLMPSMQAGFVLMGVVVGVLSVLPYIWIVLAIKERPEFQHQVGFGLTKGLRLVLSNRPYLLAFAAETLAWTAIAMVEGVFAYFLIYWAGVSQENSPIVMAMILGSAALFLPLVNLLSRRFEKKWAFVISTGVWALVHLGLWFVPQFMPIPIYFAAVLSGLGVSSAHVMPGAMTADTLEVAELSSGQRREGIFIGISNFGRKLGVSLSLFVLGWVLELTGYVANAEAQTAGALTGIRVLVAWVPLGLLLLAMAAGAAFPITRKVHADLRVRLAERRASTD